MNRIVTKEEAIEYNEKIWNKDAHPLVLGLNALAKLPGNREMWEKWSLELELDTDILHETIYMYEKNHDGSYCRGVNNVTTKTSDIIGCCGLDVFFKLNEYGDGHFEKRFHDSLLSLMFKKLRFDDIMELISTCKFKVGGVVQKNVLQQVMQLEKESFVSGINLLREIFPDFLSQMKNGVCDSGRGEVFWNGLSSVSAIKFFEDNHILTQKLIEMSIKNSAYDLNTSLFDAIVSGVKLNKDTQKIVFKEALCGSLRARALYDDRDLDYKGFLNGVMKYGESVGVEPAIFWKEVGVTVNKIKSEDYRKSSYLQKFQSLIDILIDNVGEKKYFSYKKDIFLREDFSVLMERSLLNSGVSIKKSNKKVTL
jgi:hypothetical protein